MNQTAFPFHESPRFEAFKDFYRRNYPVWEMFRQFANQVRMKGKKCGARLIWERLRWQSLIATETDDAFKMNDHHAPYFARLLALRDDRFKGFFVFKPTNYDCSDDQLLRDCDAIDRALGRPTHGAARLGEARQGAARLG